MINSNYSKTGALATLFTLGLSLFLLGGCAELPLANDPPNAPVMVSDGTHIPGAGVGIEVTCLDPDNDKITINFSAISATAHESFAWTSFIESGKVETFFLQLGVGEWEISAVARDEWDETGAIGKLDLTVHF